MKRTAILVLVAFVVVACGGSPTPTPDVVATQVAEELAAAATLTAGAPTATATPSPTAAATSMPTLTPTRTPAPTRTPKPSPIPLPVTTQPRCGTLVTAEDILSPSSIAEVGQSEITFELQRGMLQVLVQGGRLVVEEIEIRELSIGGKRATVVKQQGEYIDTEEAGRLLLLTGDATGGCLLIVITPAQLAQIVNWLHEE